MATTWEVSADKKRAVVGINGRFGTQELEKLIGDLLVMRAAMLPAVPNNPPGAEDGDTNVSAQKDPCLALKLLKDGSIRFWLRNAGLGWMVFDLSTEQACGVRNYLLANTPDMGDGVNFFTEDDGSGGATQ